MQPYYERYILHIIIGVFLSGCISNGQSSAGFCLGCALPHWPVSLYSSMHYIISICMSSHALSCFNCRMVRRGVMFAVCAVFLSMPSENLLTELGDDLMETRAWLAGRDVFYDSLYVSVFVCYNNKCVTVYRCGREWLWRRMQEFGGTEFNTVGQKPQISAADPRYGNMTCVSSLCFWCLRYIITRGNNNRGICSRDADNITHLSGVVKIWKILWFWPDASIIYVTLLFGFHVLSFFT